jgi:hypothetical protein
MSSTLSMWLWFNVGVKHLVIHLGLNHTIAVDAEETVQF